jgi:Ca2+-binding RTX toxin-like protein
MALPQAVTPIIASNPDPVLEIIYSIDNPRVVLVKNGQETLVQSTPPGTNFNFIRTVNSIKFLPTSVKVGDKGTWVYDGKVNYFDGSTRKEVGTGTESILFKNGVLFFDYKNAPGKVFYFDGATTTQISDSALVYSTLSDSYYNLLLATNKQGDLVTWKQADGKIALFDGQIIKTLDGSNIKLQTAGIGKSIVGPNVVDISPDRVVYSDSSFGKSDYLVKYSNPALDLSLGNIRNNNVPYFLQVTPDYIYYRGSTGIVQRANDGSEKSIPGSVRTFNNLSTSQGTSVAIGNDLYFTSKDANGIFQVYRFNENQAVQISQNTVNAQVTLLTVNNRLFFTASDGRDAEIYSYDGTSLLQVTNNSIDDKPLAPIASADGSTFFWYQNTSDDVSGNPLQGELYNAVQNTFATFEISDNDIYQVSRAQFNAQNGLILAGKQITLPSLDLIDPPLSLSGTDGDDDLIGKGGNDTIAGLDGNDTVTGASGNDILYGNDGYDQLDGGTGDDTILGEDGNDTILGEDGNDNLEGNDGNDTIYGGNWSDTILGGDGNDFAYGGLGKDFISGGASIDNLEGNDGSDTILGDEGDDGLAGQEGDDSLVGGNGNDRLYGWTGNDHLYGESGDDTLFGDDGNDRLYGESGNDTLFGDNGNDFAFGGTGNDSISGGNGIDNLEGNEGNDTILGSDGNDGLAGQEGDDSLVGGNGNDRLYGGLGNDILQGDGGNDTLQGDGGDDSLYGGSGNDLLTGGAGADTFNFGNDFVTGEAFSSVGLDTITDFQSGVDKIQLQRSAFAALPEALSFAIVADDSLAATSSEIIVYSQGTGSIFYNANGAVEGFGDGGSFAQLTGNPLLAATDFDLLPATVGSTGFAV